MSIFSFTEKANKKHNNKYTYDLTNYVNQHTKVIITCPTHGNFTQTPKGHLTGRGCRKCSAQTNGVNRRFTTKDFIIKANKAHEYKYDYSLTVYKTNKIPVTIICPIHGEFRQLPYMHLRGHECVKCGQIKSSNTQTKSLSQFINEAHKIHNNKYSYNNAVYKGALKPLTITCPIHGDFNQRPSDHLTKAGCPACANTKQGWSYTAWERSGKASKYFESFKLYIIKCYALEETFIKIGKTFTTIERRLNKYSLPYKYEIMTTYEAGAKEISELEIQLHAQFCSHAYTPSVKFGGSQECFSIDILPFLPNFKQ